MIYGLTTTSFRFAKTMCCIPDSRKNSFSNLNPKSKNFVESEMVGGRKSSSKKNSEGISDRELEIMERYDIKTPDQKRSCDEFFG